MKKIKRILSICLSLVMIVCMFPIYSSAAYDYLFPVNNGGKIAYVYGYSSSYGSSFHSGIDIHSSGDDTIYAAYDGVVGATANSCDPNKCGSWCDTHYNTYGNYIRINQDDGTKAYYGHLLINTLLVSVGQRVTKGQPIAKMGSSGHSTGKHLHFEVRSGDTKINVNPVSNGGSINYSYSGYGGGSSTVTPSPTITYSSISEKNYKIQSATGVYLTVDTGGNSGANVFVSNKNSSAEQNFRIQSKGNNQYYIRSLAHTEQFCLNAWTSQNVLTKQSDVKLYQANDVNSKFWGFEDAGNGYYYIRCMMNPNFVLTADSGNNNANVTVLAFDGRDTQKWKLEKIEETPIQKEYTITYKWEGGRGGPSTQSKPKGRDIKIFDDYFPNRFGYSFVGWSTSATADKAEYIPGSTFTKDADTTLYAVWSAATELSETLGRRTGESEFPYAGKCKYYKITPKYDGLYRFESTGSLDTQIFIMSPKGAVYAKDDNSGSDNNFLLDYSLNAGTTYYIEIVSKDAGKINYAFTMLFKVSYNANGGSDVPDTQYKLYKTDMKITTDVPTREGYTFLGWSVDSSAEEVDAKPGATYKGDRDILLYAVWEKNAHEHNWIWVTDKEATCIENGMRHQECECGATQNEEHYGVFHSFGEWIVVDREEEYPFTITQQRTCSFCGETETQNIVAVPTPIDPPDEILYGDVNDDGIIDGLDATRLLQYLAEWDVIINFDSADVNTDGIVDGLDITRLLQYLAEWDVVLG